MTYRFGPFTLDTDTRQLTRSRQEIHLSPKAFQLLSLLIANRARVVPKVELQAGLWPSTFVEESNLATLIAEVRRALCDSAGRAQFVRTVHRVGYRFMAETTESPQPPPSTAAHPKLFVVAGGSRFVLQQGRNVIGRGEDATIRLDSAGVSRHHAEIVVSGAEAWLNDLQSKNGTFLRGDRVTQPSRLADGDDVLLGGIALTFASRPGTATATVTSH